MAEPKTKGMEAKTASAKKDRSPNFPAITFDAALESAKKLWAEAKKHPMGTELALKHMGYTSNGRGFRVLSALRKYGLVASEGKDIRVSDDANAIFIYPEGSDERESRIQRLAMQPTIFREVLRRFPGDLPSDEHLSATLQDQMDFTASAAPEFIKVLRNSIRIAGVDGAARADAPDVAVPPEAAPSRAASALPIAPSTHVPLPKPSQNAGSTIAGQEKHAWKLGNGVWAEITITGTLSAKGLTKLRGYVALLDAEEDDTEESTETAVNDETKS